MQNLSIPFFSGTESFRKQWPQVSALLDSVIDCGCFTLGPMTKQLENALKNYTGSAHAIAVGSCTDALILALKALGIGKGDEVIVPCFTFVASASSIVHVGAKPIFVDIDPQTYNINPAVIETRITERTKAIMPVHLFSQMADMPTIKQVADKNGVKVIEDSAEAIGMWTNGNHAGLLGDVGVLSFFPTKTLGAIGDAGLILTNDMEIARTCYLLRNHGRDNVNPSLNQIIGYNSRMDEIQAAILYARLQCLSEDILKRATIAQYYDQRLSPLEPLVIPPKHNKQDYITNPVYYVYVIEAIKRDELIVHLDKNNIGTEVYYPIPLHLQPSFAYLNYHYGDFPNAEYASTRTLALPLYPDLTLQQAELVCQTIEDFYERKVV